MTDQELILALINHDEKVTYQFFFKNCRPLFLSIMRNMFDYPIDYGEFVNELYLYLMENDAKRLRQFDFRSTPYQWIKTVAIRYFLNKKSNVIDNRSNEPLYPKENEEASDRSTEALVAQMDLENLFKLMTNKRYVKVIRRLVIQGEDPITVAHELGVTVDNLYNIRRRAMLSLAEVALSDKNKYNHK